MAEGTSSPTADRTWYITQRWQAYEGESRANLLRIIAVGAFYLVHLWTYASAKGWLPQIAFLQIAESVQINDDFHKAITLLATAWAMLALGVQLALQQRLFPRWLPYFSTSCDVVALTCILCLAAGARSPLVAGYFLILVAAALRMSLPLVRFATVGCALGYLVVLGCCKWFPTFGQTSDQMRVPRYHQIVVLLAIVLAGVMLGQIIRRVRGVAEYYAQQSSQT